MALEAQVPDNIENEVLDAIRKNKYMTYEQFATLTINRFKENTRRLVQKIVESESKLIENELSIAARRIAHWREIITILNADIELIKGRK